MVDYTFHHLYRRLIARFRMETLERHWDALVRAASNRRDKNRRTT